MNLQVDNPVCILNQETAKNFLHNTDPKSKYQLFERATQMDVVVSGFTEAEEQLAHSKSCLKEKKEVSMRAYLVESKFKSSATLGNQLVSVWYDKIGQK